MEKHYEIFVGIDVSKGKADAAILKVSNVHRYYQIKKIYSQEINRLVATCDVYFPELQYVFETYSAAFLAILSSYPTTQDIINSSKSEVFDLVYKATKHHVKMDKVDKLFAYCADTLTMAEPSDISRRIIRNIVDSVFRIKLQIKSLEKEIKHIASTYPEYEHLLTITGCGPQLLRF